MKRIAILGSTGSIGTSTLDIVRSHPDEFSVVGLAAHRNAGRLIEQAREFHPTHVAIGSEEEAQAVRAALPGVRVGSGADGLCDVAAESDAQMVVVAVVGAAGLQPTLRAIEAGRHIALANKETLVTAGRMVIERARRAGCNLIPVDSEHSAIFQCLQGRAPEEVERLVLTASGGPFRDLPADQFERITKAQALKHPTWVMGPKITIDSATLMNKGLEVIEAFHLFGMTPERIRVVTHPQSIVHSMVELIDGSIMAQLGIPDMHIPILYALSYPARMRGHARHMTFGDPVALSFEAPSLTKFPCLRLAYEALAGGPAAPIALNAANEVAVEAFLAERIGFMRIPEVIETVVGATRADISTLDDIRSCDAESRRRAAACIERLESKRRP